MANFILDVGFYYHYICGGMELKIREFNDENNLEEYLSELENLEYENKYKKRNKKAKQGLTDKQKIELLENIESGR